MTSVLLSLVLVASIYYVGRWLAQSFHDWRDGPK
mgnify:CR=1 FL=1